MEALILLLGESVIPLVAVAFVVLFVGIAVAGELIAELLVRVLAAGDRGAAACPPERSAQAGPSGNLQASVQASRRPEAGSPPVVVAPPSRRRPGAWLRRARIAVVAMIGLCAGSAFLLNGPFFESTLRWLLARVKDRTGIETTFASASGNLFTGSVVMSDVTFRRSGSATSDFDLRAGRVAAAVGVLSLWSSTIRFESFHVERLRGTYTTLADPKRLVARRAFAIDDFALDDARLTVTDRSKGREVFLDVDIASWRSRPLRSDWAIFDAFFRSNARGAFDACPFTVRTADGERGKETVWQVSGFPVRKIGALLGGVFEWFAAGTVYADVRNRWCIGHELEMDMTWQLGFKEARVEAPAGAPLLVRVAGSAVAAFANRHAGTFAVQFNLSLDEGRFKAASSLDKAGLWAAAADKTLIELSRPAKKE